MLSIRRGPRETWGNCGKSCINTTTESGRGGAGGGDGAAEGRLLFLGSLPPRWRIVRRKPGFLLCTPVQVYTVPKAWPWALSWCIRHLRKCGIVRGRPLSDSWITSEISPLDLAPDSLVLATLLEGNQPSSPSSAPSHPYHPGPAGWSLVLWVVTELSP